MTDLAEDLAALGYAAPIETATAERSAETTAHVGAEGIGGDSSKLTVSREGRVMGWPELAL